jgi:autoinducer 2-degrading protein
MSRRLFLLVPALVLGAIVLDARAADDENPVVALVKTKVKDKNKPFGMAVIFKVKAGSEKDFETAFLPCAKATKKEAGCLAYHFNRDLDDESSFVVYEQFKNIAALEDHAKSKYVTELVKKIGTMLDGEPKVKVFTILGAE